MTRVVPSSGELLYAGGAQQNLVVVSPIVGDRWAIGSRQTVRWGGRTNVVIEKGRVGSAAALETWYQPNGTSLEITVSGPANVGYYIRVRDYSDPSDRTAASVASGFFEIYESTTPLIIPEILSVSPTNLVAGSTLPVTIYGTDFGSAGTISMGGELCPLMSWSNTEVVFTLSAGLTIGSYTIILTPTNPAGNSASWPFNIGEVAPPPPQPTGTTIKKLVALVNGRLGNQVRWGTYNFIADGRTRHFRIPDQWVRELPANHPDVFTLTFYDADGNVSGGEVEGSAVDEDGNPVEETTTSAIDWGSFDYENNWYHFLVPPAKGTIVNLDYSYQWWPEKQIRHFINSALLYLADDFYVTHVRDHSSGGTEYVIEHGGFPAKGIVEVHDGATRLTPFRDYRVLRGEGQECLLQLFSSATDMLRVRAAYEPQLFRLPTDTLESLALPEPIIECIILYCCWQCLLQFLPPRMRFDQAVVTQGAGTPTVRDNQTTPQIYKMLLDIEVEKRRMRPWTARGL